MTPKVSVIVATYNQADTIGRALESIVGQHTSFPYEIIIGEDASTDDTRRVCSEWAERYPELIRLMPKAPNKGLTVNYYDCLEAARGEYIADLAGDDRWVNPDKLQMQVEFLDRHPEVTMVHTAWVPVDAATGKEGEAVVQPFPEVEEGHSSVVRLLRHDKPQPIHLSTSMYRREDAMRVYREYREFMRGQMMEDLTLSCLLLEESCAGYLPVVTLAYTVGGNSVCNPTNMVRMARFYRNSLDVTCRLADMTVTPRRILADSLKRQAHHALSLAIASGVRDEVRSTLTVCRRHKIKLPAKSYLKRAVYLMGRLFRRG
ncbi:MAG: glycosyltransferase family 2 protein [Duncaniella sp.]|nr:glycosyltransferase family 2 protein [Duncaniella sp.]